MYIENGYFGLIKSKVLEIGFRAEFQASMTLPMTGWRLSKLFEVNILRNTNNN